MRAYPVQGAAVADQALQVVDHVSVSARRGVPPRPYTSPGTTGTA